jgi:hypothetical protein
MRSFPSKIFTKKEFGDEGVKLLSDARDQINRVGRGRISMTTSDPDALVYVDEIAQGTGKADVGDLIPGVYRVLIVIPSGEGREYQVEVTANQTSRLAVNWDIDSLLVFGPTYAGFKYRTEKDHALEAVLVRTLARAHTNASIAATVGVTYQRSRLGVTGTSYNTTTGEIFRSGHIELTGTPPNDIMVTRLAECLVTRAGEACAEGVLPVSHPEYTAPPAPPKVDDSPALPEPPPATPSIIARTDETSGSVRSWPKWLAAGGSAALLVGGTLLVNKGRHICDLPVSDCQIPLSYAVAGYTALDAGVALGAVSAYWFYTDDLRPEKAPAKWLVIGGSALLAAGIVVYAFDEDPSSAGGRYYWDTAPPGIALGALGLASIGVGAWCWTRPAHTLSMPLVSVSASHAMIGWSGGF